MAHLYKVDEQFKNVKTTDELLSKAGLDWEVESQPIYREDGKLIDVAKVNVRLDNDYILGVVGAKYEVVQNREAFAFIDNLVGEVVFENAGELFGGKFVFVQADLASRYLVDYGEEVDCKLVFTNGHDGTAAVRANIIPIISGKTFNVPVHGVKRNFTGLHTKNVKSKMLFAKNTMDVAHSYLKAVMNDTLILGTVVVSEMQKQAFVEALLPITNQATERSYNNMIERRAELLARIEVDTVLGLVLGVSDFIENAEPNRKTKTYEDNLFANVVNNKTLLDKAYKLAYKMFVNN